MAGDVTAAGDLAPASPRAALSDSFKALLEKRLVIFDGAMGTMIQRHRFSEQQFRGERFKEWRSDLRGNNDLLVITQPQEGPGALGMGRGRHWGRR